MTQYPVPIGSTSRQRHSIGSENVAAKSTNAPVKFARERLKHERIHESLLGEISSGRLRPGDALPTEKQLSEMLRVSRGTVRFALAELEQDGHVRRVQGKGTYVSDATTKQAQPIADTQPLALLVPYVDDSFYSSLVAGFDRAAHHVGRSALVCGTDNEIGKQADCLMRVTFQGVRGVILNPAATSETPAYQVRIVQEAGIPVVLLHRGVAGVSAPAFKIPGDEVGRAAARLILNAGHTCIALATTPLPQYELGFRDELAAAGVEMPDELVDHHYFVGERDAHRCDYEQHVEQLLDRILDGKHRATAIFSTYDPISEAIYLAAVRRGLRVPEDISIVSFGYSERRGAIRQQLAAVTIDEGDAARRAVNCIEEMRSGRRGICDGTVEMLKLGVSPGRSLSVPAIA